MVRAPATEMSRNMGEWTNSDHLPLKGEGRRAKRAGWGSSFAQWTPIPTLPLSGGGSAISAFTRVFDALWPERRRLRLCCAIAAAGFALLVSTGGAKAQGFSSP